MSLFEVFGPSLVGCAVGILSTLVFHVWSLRRYRDTRVSEATRALRKLLVNVRDEHTERLFGDPAVAGHDALDIPRRRHDEICNLLEISISDISAEFRGKTFAGRGGRNRLRRMRAAQDAYLHPKRNPGDPGQAIARLDDFLEAIQKL